MSNINEKDAFKHVSYLWDHDRAAELEGDEVALLLYRSNLLGADLRLTNYGGGNTSCKAIARDPLTGAETEVMWIKGSGGDIGTLTRSGLAALYVDRLRSLENVYQGFLIIVFMIWPQKHHLSIRRYMASCRSSISTTCTLMQR